MADNRRRARGDDPNPAPTLAYGIFGAILVFVIIVGVQALYYHEQRKEDFRKTIAPAPEELSLLRATQLEQIHSYRWIDEKQGIVAIPIERAMELTTREIGASR